MTCAGSEGRIRPGQSMELEQIAAHVQQRLGRQVRHLRLMLRDQGLVLQGRACSYYAKQLAQHAVMQATHYLILANEIEVA
jgi:hypothetical protein